MKTIAVITGASSGMGRRFAETLEEFGTFDEVWAIARRAERLEELKETVPYPLRPLAMDLTDRQSYKTYAALLAEEKPQIGLLINASGFGKFRATLDEPLEVNLNMVDLNCQALQALCQLSIPYMAPGSKIVNIASVAAFQPTPYINVYAATKAFVLSYSRSLNREMKSRGIHVMAACPFWTKSEFFDRAIDEGKPRVVKKYVAMYTPAQVVARTWKDLKKGKDVSICGFKAKGQTFLTKLLPHGFVMNFWLNQQKLK